LTSGSPTIATNSSASNPAVASIAASTAGSPRFFGSSHIARSITSR